MKAAPVIAAAVLAGVIGCELIFLSRSVADRPSATTVSDNMTAAPQPDRSTEWEATILARPLFSPDRRPAADGPLADDQSGLPRVTGIIIEGSRRQVIFAGHQNDWIAVIEGATIGRYRVKIIAPDHVEIVGADGDHVLQPRFSAHKRSSGSEGSGLLNAPGLSMLHPAATLHNLLSTKSDIAP